MKSVFIALFTTAVLSTSAQFSFEADISQSVPNEGKFAKTVYLFGGHGLAIEPKYALNEKWQVGLQYEINLFYNFLAALEDSPRVKNAKVESISGSITFRPNTDRKVHFGVVPGLFFVKGGYSIPLDGGLVLHEPYRSFGVQVNMDWYSGQWKLGTSYTILRNVHFITFLKLGYKI